jgi:(5-formylfuran-3-yl)methyl phosphate synthase
VRNSDEIANLAPRRVKRSLIVALHDLISRRCTRRPYVPPIDSRPLLLVSVRSELEAAAAIAGGADILDVKDPARGSLGCPEPHVLKAVCLKASDRNVRVTTALGEVAEWANQNPFAIPPGVAFAKLGLAGLGERPDWIEAWREVRRRFNSQRTGMGWVAVAYVDNSAATAPPVHDVATAAIETGCAGLLLDTYDKSSGTLFDSASQAQIDELAERMHTAGKFLAAAGRLDLNDVARLSSSAVDIVAVRSAVCAQSDRKGVVSTDLVAACKAALQPRQRQLSGAC